MKSAREVISCYKIYMVDEGITHAPVQTVGVKTILGGEAGYERNVPMQVT